jgi:hypothetical protein
VGQPVVDLHGVQGGPSKRHQRPYRGGGYCGRGMLASSGRRDGVLVLIHAPVVQLRLDSIEACVDVIEAGIYRLKRCRERRREPRRRDLLARNLLDQLRHMDEADR